MVIKYIKLSNVTAKPLTELVTKIGSVNYPEGISLCSWGIDSDGVEWCAIPDVDINTNFNVLQGCLTEIGGLLDLSENEATGIKEMMLSGKFNLHDIIPTSFEVFTPNNNFPKPL